MRERRKGLYKLSNTAWVGHFCRETARQGQHHLGTGPHPRPPDQGREQGPRVSSNVPLGEARLDFKGAVGFVLWRDHKNDLGLLLKPEFWSPPQTARGAPGHRHRDLGQQGHPRRETRRNPAQRASLQRAPGARRPVCAPQGTQPPGPDTSTPTPGPSRSGKRTAFGPEPNPQVTKGHLPSSQDEKGSSTPCSTGLSSGASGGSRPDTRPPAAGRPHCRGPAPVRTGSAVPSGSAPQARGGPALAPRRGTLPPTSALAAVRRKKPP